jgi:hypothetical protein
MDIEILIAEKSQKELRTSADHHEGSSEVHVFIQWGKSFLPGLTFK